MAGTQELTKARRIRKNKESEIVTTERDSLEIHVDLCELRYKQLDDRMTRVEQRISDINIDLQEFKTEMRERFDELKSMIAVNQTHRFNTMVATAGTVIVALVGMLGYLITHLPK